VVPTPEPSIESATSPVRTTFRALASVAAPTTLVTALLYYFGWASSAYEARRLGLGFDVSLFGYSTPDYLLRSLSSMFWPLFLGLVALLAGLLIHALVVAWAEAGGTLTGPAAAHRRLRLRWLVRGLLALGLLFAFTSAATVFRPDPSAFVSLAAPTAALLAIVSVGYAIHLFQRYLWRHRAGSFAHLEALRLVGISVGLTLLLLTAFWTVSHYAAIKGVDLGRQVEASIGEAPTATLYSQKRLFLQSPVHETDLQDANAAYRFQYTGLKFLFLANHRYFLRPADTSSEVNIILPDTPDIRIELSQR
jgi:hypothetical protein